MPRPASQFASLTFTQPNLAKAMTTSGPGVAKHASELHLTDSGVPTHTSAAVNNFASLTAEQFNTFQLSKEPIGN